MDDFDRQRALRQEAADRAVFVGRLRRFGRVLVLDRAMFVFMVLIMMGKMFMIVMSVMVMHMMRIMLVPVMRMVLMTARVTVVVQPHPEHERRDIGDAEDDGDKAFGSEHAVATTLKVAQSTLQASVRVGQSKPIEFTQNSPKSVSQSPRLTRTCSEHEFPARRQTVVICAAL